MTGTMLIAPRLLRVRHIAYLHTAHGGESRDHLRRVHAGGKGGSGVRHVESGDITRGVTKEAVNYSAPVDPVSCDYSGRADADAGGTGGARWVERSDIARGVAHEAMKCRVGVPSRGLSSIVNADRLSLKRVRHVESGEPPFRVHEAVRTDGVVEKSRNRSRLVDAHGSRIQRGWGIEFSQFTCRRAHETVG